MFILKRLTILWILLAASFPVSNQIFDDIPPLPADIVFSSSYEVENTDNTTKNVYSLVLLDSETMTYIPLSDYQGRPIRWSPQGDKLAIVRTRNVIGDGFSDIEVCIITMPDVGQICMDEVVRHYYLSDLDITWSNDGQRIYFVSTQQETFRLIEADVATGQTLRVIYETDYRRDEWGEGITISWSQDLNYIAIGVGSGNRPPGVLVNLETHGEVHISEIIYPYVEPVIEEEYPNSSYACGQFSPTADYLVGIIPTDFDGVEERGQRIVIFDTSGQIVHMIEQPNHRIFCPTWSSDGNTLYIPGFNWETYDRVFYIYHLDREELVPLVENIDLGTTIILSPDETHVAFSGMNDPYGRAIYVLYPDGTIHKFCELEHSCSWPVWRPMGDWNAHN